MKFYRPTKVSFEIKLSLIIFLWIALPFDTAASGLPYVRNFLPHEYKASPQNWSIVQDQQGIMYFGNNDGVLTYDGVSWRLVKLPGVGPLAIDKNGLIYVGLDNDIGYLKPDHQGILRFHSLLPEVPAAHREINICYRVYVLEDQVVFQTADKLYQYKNGEITVVSTENGFYFSFHVNEDFYVAEAGMGIRMLKGNALDDFIPASLFNGDEIISILPYNKHALLFISVEQGIQIYENPHTGLHQSPVFREANDYIRLHQAYSAVRGSNGEYAIGTVSGGILVVAPDGKIREIYNKKTGLLDNSVYSLFYDRNDQLWAALDNGISLVQLNVPFTYYDERSGLSGSVMCLDYFNNRLYVGTSQHVFAANKNGTFEAVSGTASQNFHLYASHGSLLLANLDGIHEIRGNKAFQVEGTRPVSALSFCTHTADGDNILVGAINGLHVMNRNKSGWILKSRVSGFNKPSYKVESDLNHNIWVSTFLDMYNLVLNQDADSVISTVLCGVEQGLPSGYAMPFTLEPGEVVFGTEKGVYQYFESEKAFKPHPGFNLLTGKVLQLYKDTDGHIWFEQLLPSGNYEKGVLKTIDGISHVNKKAFFKFSHLGSGDCPYNICRVPDGSVYFGTGLGLLQYKPDKEPDYEKPFHTIIRGVYLRDSLLYGGHGVLPASDDVQPMVLNFDKREMAFYFSASFYEDADKNLYSFRLKGMDDQWSEWSADHKKEYTNLHEGYYTFEVKAKNIYGIVGSTDVFNIRILAPWYRTWWAYGFYTVLFLLFIWQVTKLNAKRLDRQNKLLETLIASRTVALREQKLKTEEANEELSQTNQKLFETNNELNQINQTLKITLQTVSTQKKEIEDAHNHITIQNKELHHYREHLEQLVEARTAELLQAKNRAEESDRLKTAFLQNMSHEIRTPMNGILGFLRLLEDPEIDVEIRSGYIDIIQESGNRLLKTINDIIEISRIEANQLAVNFSPVDVSKLIEYHLKFHSHQANEKGISLVNASQVPAERSVIVSDEHLLNGIMTNLVGNAIKFTKSGRIEVGNYLQNGSLVFYVRDSGIGIPADKVESIFERFVQADLKSTREYEGSGLGLSIVKGYLEKLDGRIWLESEPGRGSVFYFSIPYRQALEPINKEKQDFTKAAINLKKLKVLIAEDDPDSLLYLESILKDKVGQILRVDNGIDAVKIFRENQDISLILLDIKMPGKNGYEVVREIRSFNNSVIIIAQTAFAMRDDNNKAIDAGCNDFITKPVDRNKLIQLISRHCR